MGSLTESATTEVFTPEQLSCRMMRLQVDGKFPGVLGEPLGYLHSKATTSTACIQWHFD